MELLPIRGQPQPPGEILTVPKYQFVAEGPNQESHKGSVEAPTHAAARQKLEQHGFRVLTIVPETAEDGPHLMPPGQPASGLSESQELTLDPAVSPVQSQQPATHLGELPVATPAHVAQQQPVQFPQQQAPQPSPAPAIMGQASTHGGADDAYIRPLARSFEPWVLDISFRKFVTPNAVSVIFILGLAFAVLVFLSITYTTGMSIYNLFRLRSLMGDSWRMITTLGWMLFTWLVSVVTIVLGVFLTRVFCEAMLVLFRMGDNLEQMRRK